MAASQKVTLPPGFTLDSESQSTPKTPEPVSPKSTVPAGFVLDSETPTEAPAQETQKSKTSLIIDAIATPILKATFGQPIIQANEAAKLALEAVGGVQRDLFSLGDYALGRMIGVQNPDERAGQTATGEKPSLLGEGGQRLIGGMRNFDPAHPVQSFASGTMQDPSQLNFLDQTVGQIAGETLPFTMGGSAIAKAGQMSAMPEVGGVGKSGIPTLPTQVNMALEDINSIKQNMMLKATNQGQLVIDPITQGVMSRPTKSQNVASLTTFGGEPMPQSMMAPEQAASRLPGIPTNEQVASVRSVGMENTAQPLINSAGQPINQAGDLVIPSREFKSGASFEPPSATRGTIEQFASEDDWNYYKKLLDKHDAEQERYAQFQRQVAEQRMVEAKKAEQMGGSIDLIYPDFYFENRFMVADTRKPLLLPSETVRQMTPPDEANALRADFIKDVSESGKPVDWGERPWHSPYVAKEAEVTAPVDPKLKVIRDKMPVDIHGLMMPEDQKLVDDVRKIIVPGPSAYNMPNISDAMKRSADLSGDNTSIFNQLMNLYARKSISNFDRIGSPGSPTRTIGKMLYRQAMDAHLVSQGRTQQAYRLIFDSGRLLRDNPELQKNWVNVLEKGEIPKNDMVRKTALIWQTLFDQIDTEVRALNPGFKSVKNYFPHQYSQETLEAFTQKSAKRQAALDAIKKAEHDSGNMIDDSQVELLLDKYIRKKIDPNPHFDYEREYNLPGYETDPLKIAELYFPKAFRRIENAKQFGWNNEKGMQLISMMPDEPGVRVPIAGKELRLDRNKSMATQALEMVTNVTASGGTARDIALAKKTRSLQYLTNQMTSAMFNISNFDQGAVGAFITSKPGSFWKTAKNMIFNTNRETLNNYGLAMDHLIDDMSNSMSVAKSVGFPHTESFNRQYAEMAARMDLPKIISDLKSGRDVDYWTRYLDRANIDAKKLVQTGWDNDTFHKFTNYMVDLTQGGLSNANYPIYGKSPGWALAYTLKNFAVQWGDFFERFVIDEMAHGNPMPAIRMTAALAASGYVKQDIINFLYNKKDKPILWGNNKESYKRVAGWIGHSGGIGLANDLVQSALFNDTTQVERILTPVPVGMAVQAFNRPGQFLANRVITPAAAVAGNAIGGPGLGQAAAFGTSAILNRLMHDEQVNK